MKRTPVSRLAHGDEPGRLGLSSFMNSSPLSNEGIIAHLALSRKLFAMELELVVCLEVVVKQYSRSVELSLKPSRIALFSESASEKPRP